MSNACTECGHANRDDANRCTECGALTPRFAASFKRAVILFLISAPLMAGAALWYFHTIDNIGR